MSVSSEIRSSRADGAQTPFPDDDGDGSPAVRSQFATPVPPPLPPAPSHQNNTRQQATQPSSSTLQRQHSQRESTRVVIFQRDDKGYGLTVSGESPVYVQTVRAGGAAEKAGVCVNDCIIKVNGHLVTKCNHHDVVAHIRSGTFVALTVLRHGTSERAAAANRRSPMSQQLYPHATTARQSHSAVSNQQFVHQSSLSSFDSSSKPPLSSVNNDTYLVSDSRDSSALQNSSSFINHANNDPMQQHSYYSGGMQHQSGGRSNIVRGRPSHSGGQTSSRRHRIDSNVSTASFSGFPSNQPSLPTNKPRNNVHLVRGDDEPDFIHDQRQRYIEQTRIDTLRRMRERETQYLSTLEFRQLSAAAKSSKDASPTAPPAAASVANETYNIPNGESTSVFGDSSTAMMMAAEDLTSEIAAIKRRVNELDEHIKRECSTVTPDANLLSPADVVRAHHHRSTLADQHSRQHSSPDIYKTSQSNADVAVNYGYESSAVNNNRSNHAQCMHYAADDHHDHNNHNYCSSDFAGSASSMRGGNGHYMHAPPPLPLHTQRSGSMQQQQQNFPGAKKTPSLLELPEMVENSAASDQSRRVSSPGAFHLIHPVPIVGRHPSSKLSSSFNNSVSSDSLHTLVPSSAAAPAAPQRRLGGFGQVVDRFFAPQPPPLPPPNIPNVANPREIPSHFGVLPHHHMPSITPTFSNVALLFSNYDEMCKQDAFLATFIHYLNSTGDSSPVLFDLLCSEYYRLTTSSKISKDLRRKWAFEIHSTFLMPDSPLELVYAFDAASRAELVDEIDRAFVLEMENFSKNQHFLRKVLKDARDRVRRSCIDSLLAQFVRNCEWGMDTSIAGMPSENELSAALNSLEKSRTIMEDTIGLDLITVTISGGAWEPHIMRDMRQVALGCSFATFLKLRNVKINTPRIDCGPSGNLIDKWPVYLSKQQSATVLSAMLFNSNNLSPKDACGSTTHWWSSSVPQSNSNALGGLAGGTTATAAAAAQQQRNKITKSKSKDSMHSQQQQENISAGSVGNRLLLLTMHHAGNKSFAGGHHQQQQHHQNHNLKPVVCSTNSNSMIKHCGICGMRLWGVAPQGLQCSQCDLYLHRSCLAERNGVVAEPCIASSTITSSAGAGTAMPGTANSSPGSAAVSAANMTANLAKSTSGISLKPASSFIKRIKKRRSAGAAISTATNETATISSSTVAIMSETSSKKVIAKLSHHDVSNKKTEELHENVVRSRSPQLHKASMAAAATEVSSSTQKNDVVATASSSAVVDDSTVTSRKSADESAATPNALADGSLLPAAENEPKSPFPKRKSTNDGFVNNNHSHGDETKDILLTSSSQNRQKVSTTSAGGLIPRSESMKARHYTADATTTSGSPNKRSGALPKMKRKSDPAQINNVQMQLPRSRSDLSSCNGVLLRAGSTSTTINNDTTESSSLNSHSRLTPLSSATSTASISGGSSGGAGTATAASSTLTDSMSMSAKSTTTTTTTDLISTAETTTAPSAALDEADDDSEPDAAGALSNSSNIMQHLVVDDERPWTQRIDAAVLARMSREEQQRQEICAELLSTERRHVRTLKTLVHIFRDPLRQAQLMPPDMLALVFGHVDELIIVHMRIKQLLKQCLKPLENAAKPTGDNTEESNVEKSASQTSGANQNQAATDASPCSANVAAPAANSSPGIAAELFGPVGTALQQAFGVIGPNGKELERAAAAYCSERTEARKVLMRARKARGDAGTKLNAFLLNASASPWCRRFELQDMLACEMQRLTRYPLLLERLLKYSNDDVGQSSSAGETSNQIDDGEKHRIQTAIDSCRRINSIVNTATQERENYYRLVEFDARLDKSALSDPSNSMVAQSLKRYVPFTLLPPARRLLFDGPLVWRLHEKRELILYVMLFDDVLVLLTPTGPGAGAGGSVSGGTGKDALSLLSGVSGGNMGGLGGNLSGGAFFAPFAAASMQLSSNSGGSSTAKTINSAHSFDGGLGTAVGGGGGANFQNLSANQNLGRSYQLKFHERLFGSSETRCIYLPIMELDKLLVKDVATDSRAFFLITATKTPQMYEMLADSQQDRQRWTSKINDAIVASCAVGSSLLMRPRNRASHLYEQVPDDFDESFSTRQLSKTRTKQTNSGQKPKKSTSGGSSSVVSTITKSVSLIVENSTDRKPSPTSSSTLSSSSFSSTHSNASSMSTASSSSSAMAGSSGGGSGTLSAATSDAGTLRNDDFADDKSRSQSPRRNAEENEFYPVPELPARNFMRRLSDITDHRCMTTNFAGGVNATKSALSNNEDFSALSSTTTKGGTNGRVKANTGGGGMPPPLPPRDNLLLMLKQQHQNAEQNGQLSAANALNNNATRFMRRQHHVREYDEPADAAAAAVTAAAASVMPKSGSLLLNPALNNGETPLLGDNVALEEAVITKKKLSASVSCPVGNGDLSHTEVDAEILDMDDEEVLRSTTPASSTFCGVVADSDVIISRNVDVDSADEIFSAAAAPPSASTSIIQLADLLYRQAVQLQAQQQLHMLPSTAVDGNADSTLINSTALPSINSIQLSQYKQHTAKADAMRSLVRQLVMENEMLKRERLKSQSTMAVAWAGASPEDPAVERSMLAAVDNESQEIRTNAFEPNSSISVDDVDDKKDAANEADDTVSGAAAIPTTVADADDAAKRIAVPVHRENWNTAVDDENRTSAVEEPPPPETDISAAISEMDGRDSAGDAGPVMASDAVDESHPEITNNNESVADSCVPEKADEKRHDDAIGNSVSGGQPTIMTADDFAVSNM